MGLFENFPYTNFHNLNLDWIIKVLKNAVAELEEIQTNWESVRDTANTAKTTADSAATKAENARVTANGAMAKSISAEDTAKAAKTQAEGAELIANAAQNAAVEAQAIANEANETAARAENTAGVAQATANGIDAKATTALENSTNAVTTANAAKTAATNADSKVDALTTTVNTIGKTANNALSLSQTNEKDIAVVEADITELQTRYKRTINTRRVWTPSQSAYSLTTADFDRGIYTLSVDYSEDTETLSYFDTISSPFVAMDNLHCYLGSNIAQRVYVPAIVAQHPTSSKPTAIVYFLLPKTQPNTTNGNRLYVQLETETVSRTIGLNT